MNTKIKKEDYKIPNSVIRGILKDCVNIPKIGYEDTISVYIHRVNSKLDNYIENNIVVKQLSCFETLPDNDLDKKSFAYMANQIKEEEYDAIIKHIQDCIDNYINYLKSIPGCDKFPTINPEISKLEEFRKVVNKKDVIAILKYYSKDGLRPTIDEIKRYNKMRKNYHHY